MPVTATFDEYSRLSPGDRALLIRSGVVAPGTRRTELPLLLLMLGRPRTCVPGLLVYAFGFGYTDSPFTPKLVLGALLAFLIAFSANLHNAYTDLDEDARNLPGRGWILARLGMLRLLTALVVVDFFMIVSSAFINPSFLVLMVFAVIGLHQYSFRPLRMKARPMLGLYIFAQAVAFPFMFGWLTVRPAKTLAERSSYVAMLVFFIMWFAAKGMFKNVPDYYGDRAVGLRTSATVFPTWRAAATACSIATVASYLSLAVIIGFGLEPIRFLIPLGWLPIVIRQCRRLIAAEDAAVGNDILRTDMLVSSGFLGTLLILGVPLWLGGCTVTVSVLVLLGSDRLRIDSRRREDATAHPVTGPGTG